MPKMRWRTARKQPVNPRGFTIVEVMIVLAVTGLLFVSVVLVINGRQEAAQFQTSINETKSQLRQIANEVASGYFPSDDTYQCNTAGGKVSLVTKAVGVDSRGECDFI